MTKKQIIERVYDGISGLTIIWSKEFGFEISDVNPLYNDMTGLFYKKVPCTDFRFKKDAKNFINDMINDWNNQ